MKISNRQKREFLGLQSADDVDNAIAKALSSIELERENDGDQRKQLADRLLSDGLKIQKVASQINLMENDMCRIGQDVEFELQKIKISQAVDEEVTELLDLLENCSEKTLPVFLDQNKLMKLCVMYSSETNCNKVKSDMKKISKCEVMAKYLTGEKIVIQLQITIPEISDQQVAELHSIPFFHDKTTFELQLMEHQFLVYDDYSTMVTPDCRFINSKTIFCDANRTFNRQLSSCIGGVFWNETISKCNFNSWKDSVNCYSKDVSGYGVLISHNKAIQITKRRSDDDSRRQVNRRAKSLQPGIQVVQNGVDFIQQGTCDGYIFQTGRFTC